VVFGTILGRLAR